MGFALLEHILPVLASQHPDDVVRHGQVHLHERRRSQREDLLRGVTLVAPSHELDASRAEVKQEDVDEGPTPRPTGVQ